MAETITVTVPELPLVSQATGDELIAVWDQGRLARIPQGALRGTRTYSGPSAPPATPSGIMALSPIPVLSDRWRNTETGDEWKVTSLDPFVWEPDGNVKGADGVSNIPGPPGPSVVGPTGPSGRTLTKVAGESIADWRAVILDEGDRFRLANINNPAHRQRVVGIVSVGASALSSVVAQTAGDVKGPEGGFTANAPLFVGPGGALVATPPTAGWRQIVATAVTSGQIVVALGEASVIEDGDALIGEGGFAVAADTSSARAGSASTEWMAPSATTQHIAGQGHTFVRSQFAGFPVPPQIRSLWVHGLTQPGDAPPARYVRGRGPMEIQDALGAWWCLDLSAGRVNVKWFGAKGDVFPLVQCSIAAGSTALWSALAAFTSADVGKVIEIEGAGPGGGPLLTTIQSVTDATHVVLAAPASTSTALATTIGRYGTDDAPAVQAALTAALVLTTTQLATLYYPMGRYFHGAQSAGTVPGGNDQLGLYNGLIVEGDGVWATKLYATQANSAGLLRIGWFDHKAAVTFRRFQMVSTLDASKVANRGRNNGIGLHVFNPTASANDPLVGLHSAITVKFDHIEVSCDDVNEGSAQIRKGIWFKPIEVDYQFLPTFEWCNFVVPGIGTLSDLASLPALTLANGALDPNQNAVHVHLKHCYLPAFKGKNYFNGFAKIGVWSESTLTYLGAPGRQEGFDCTGVEAAGQITGMYFSHAYVDGSGNPAEPDIMSDEIRIIGGQFSALGPDLWFDRWQIVTVSKCHFIFQKKVDAAFYGPFTPAVLFSSCSDWTVEGCMFSGGGFSSVDGNGNATSAAVGIKVLGASTWGLIKGNRFNHGGMPWYISTAPSVWATAGGQRTIQAEGNQHGGRHNSAWAVVLPSYDPHGIVAETSVSQGSDTDFFDTISKSSSAATSPLQRNRRLRGDYASNTTNVALGSYTFNGLNSIGVERAAASLFVSWARNSSGTEASNLNFGMMVNGAPTTAMTLDGFSNAVTFGVQIIGRSVGFLSDNAYDVGSASNRARNIYAANATIQTSDASLKSGFRALTDAELDAWGEVQPGLFRWKDALAKKGKAGARWHAGYLAQDVRDALVRHGIDPAATALFCEDPLTRWVEKTRIVKGRVVEASPGEDAPSNDAPTMSDLQAGRTLDVVQTPEQTVNAVEVEQVLEETYQVEEPVIGDDGKPVTVMGLRYAECAVWDAAWTRRELSRIVDRVAALQPPTAS